MEKNSWPKLSAKALQAVTSGTETSPLSSQVASAASWSTMPSTQGGGIDGGGKGGGGASLHTAIAPVVAVARGAEASSS